VVYGARLAIMSDNDDDLASAGSDVERQAVADVSDDDEDVPKKKKDKKDSQGKKRKAVAEAAEDEGEDEGEEEDGEEGGGYAEEEYHGDKMSGLFVQHGAHREYAVPEEFVIHKAPKVLHVSNGEEISNMIKYSGMKYWGNLKWYHVTVMGGMNLTNKEMTRAPYVCLNVEGNTETDDPNWLRPIAPAIMKTMLPKWQEQIKETFGHNKDKLKRVLHQYADVLSLTADFPKLDPAKLGLGRGGFKLLKTRKLKSMRAPDSKTGPGRGGKKQAAAPKDNGPSPPPSNAEYMTAGTVVALLGATTTFQDSTGTWYAAYLDDPLEVL
tara:strand:- start:10293 stop:11264 length:972 start_codon:yes stop_codon:yes gene_type:complete